MLGVKRFGGGAGAVPAAARAAADKIELIASAEAFIVATGAAIRHGRGSAYCSPTLDRTQLPGPEGFRDGESYAATKAHELTHIAGPELAALLGSSNHATGRHN